MIKEEDLIKYLNYIGITKKTHQKKILNTYEICFKNAYRVSKFRGLIEELGYADEAADNIIQYLIMPQFRDKMNKEIKANKGVWGLK